MRECAPCSHTDGCALASSSSNGRLPAVAGQGDTAVQCEEAYHHGVIGGWGCGTARGWLSAEFLLACHTSDMALTIAKVLFIITKPQLVLKQVVKVHYDQRL